MKINTQKVTHQLIGDEVIVIHFDTGSYYSMLGSAAQIWGMIEAGCSAPVICARYGDLSAAVSAFLSELVSENLVVEEPAEAADAAEWGTPILHEAPALIKHEDMQQLLLADPLHEVEEGGWPNVKPE